MKTMGKSQLIGVPETLLVALWARAAASGRGDEGIIYDAKAVEMVGEIDYDFGKFEGGSDLSKVGVAVRTKLLDEGVKGFLKRKPNAVVVNLGAGLDTRHARLGVDQRVKWYEVDVEESIELRRQFFEEKEGYEFIAKSMFDYSWMDDIESEGGDVLIIAEGVFMYFEEEKLRGLFDRMVERFGGGEMLFETLGPFLVKKSEKHDMLSKIDSSAEFKWGNGDSREVERWNSRLKLIEDWFLSDFYRKRWGRFGWLMKLKFLRNRLMTKIVHMRIE